MIKIDTTTRRVIVATWKHNRCDNHARVIQETLREERRHSDRSPARDGATESLCTFPPPSWKALSSGAQSRSSTWRDLSRAHHNNGSQPHIHNALYGQETHRNTISFPFRNRYINNLPILYINSLSPLCLSVTRRFCILIHRQNRPNIW
jgi:hypothetical protein